MSGQTSPVQFGSIYAMARAMTEKPPHRNDCGTIPAFQDCPPQTERVSSYDERHFVTYLRLLEAAKEGADWREVASVIFGLDADADPVRARTVHDSHLARARWMTESGYRHLLEPRLQ